MIPIIIVHIGNSYYLKAVIKQAKIYNPTTPIYLISDKSTKKMAAGLCNHIPIENFQISAEHFKEIYKHRSSNNYNFELFCFQRWFIIQDFVTRNEINRFVCIDSDFLLFDNVDTFLSPFFNYDFTICGSCLPNCSMFTKTSIIKFCDFIKRMYTNQQMDTELLQEYENFKKSGELGGICDMTAFTWYQKYYPGTVKNLTIPYNGKAVDDCYYMSSGYKIDQRNKQLIMNRIPKLIIWENNLPYGIYIKTNEKIRFSGIHLQGGAKRKIYKFIVNENKEREKGLFNFLIWNFSPSTIKYRIKRIINKFNLTIGKRK